MNKPKTQEGVTVSSNAIRHNLLGVCMAKGVEYWSVKAPSSPQPVGNISLGMDFMEKFKSDDWVKLTDPGTGVLCAFAAKLLYISFHGRKITITSRFHGHETVGMAMLFDTGSDLTYLHTDVYDQVLYEVSEILQSKKSPIFGFGPLELGFKGISSATKYLIIQPVNYLAWDEIERKHY